MPKVTINFASGAPLTVDDVPDGTTDIQIANRIRDKFPAREIKSIQGVQPASLGDRLKDFATTRQKQVFGKDLPQLALGVLDDVTFGKTSDIIPAQTADEKKSRSMGREAVAAFPGMRMIPSLSGKSLVMPTLANLGRLLQARSAAAQAAKAAAPAAAPGAGINPGLVKLLQGTGLGAGPTLAYELYKHFFP